MIEEDRDDLGVVRHAGPTVMYHSG